MSNAYESEELTYQPEVNIGNQLQVAQQKTVSANFARNVNKGLDNVKHERNI